MRNTPVTFTTAAASYCHRLKSTRRDYNGAKTNAGGTDIGRRLRDIDSLEKGEQRRKGEREGRREEEGGERSSRIQY